MTPELRAKIEAYLKHFANNVSQFCYCSGPTCSGCEAQTQKLVTMGFQEAVNLLAPLIEALEFYRCDDFHGLKVGDMLTERSAELIYESGSKARQALAELEKKLEQK